MKRRMIKGMEILVVTAMTVLMAGCKNGEGLKNQKEAGSVLYGGKSDDKADSVIADRLQKTDTWEGIKKYKVDRVKEFETVIDECGLEYEAAAGNMAIHGKYTDEVLKKEYVTEFMAHSLTDYPNRVISTQLELQCEYHKDKGMEDRYCELLYGFIQITDDKELKTIIDSVETLKTKINEGFHYTGENCSLKTTEKYTARIYLNFIYKDFESIMVEEEEKVYTEFDSIDEYDRFYEQLKEESLDVDNYLTEDNNLAVGVNLRGYVQSLDMRTAKYTPDEYVEKLEKYFNIKEETKERLLSEIALWQDITKWNSELLDRRFMDEPSYVQYPDEYMTKYDKLFFVFPVKVEGLLNR